MTSSKRLLFMVMTLVALMKVNAVTLDTAMANAIVQFHNEARQMEPASNMQMMTWDPSLAHNAQQWSDDCKFQHQSGQSWGENLSATSYREGMNMTDALKRMFDMWTSEKKYNTGGTFAECCSMTGSKCCHYTQVIWAKTTKVGCGLTKCDALGYYNDSWPNMLYLACYYTPRGNKPTCVYDWSPYETN